MNNIKYPDMRLDLRRCTNSLRDKAHQESVWIKHQPSLKNDSFTEIVHFFYDDTSLSTEPNAWLGVIICDDLEVDAVKVLISAIDTLFAKFGTEEMDETYIRAPDWDHVVRAAEHLGALLDRSDQIA